MKLPAFLRVDVGKYRLALGTPLRVQVLYAFAPFVILSLADGWYKEPLFAWSPLAFWIADVTKFVLVPALSLALLARNAGITPRHYGLERPANLDQSDFFELLVLLCAVMAYVYFASSLLWSSPSSLQPFSTAWSQAAGSCCCAACGR